MLTFLCRVACPATLIALVAGTGSSQCEMTRAYSPDPEVNAQYGKSIALELPLLFVGEPDRSDGGRVVVQTLAGSNLYLVDLLAPSGLAAGDSFGSSLAVDGSLLVVGAESSALSGVAAGAAFVFEESNGVWSESAQLLPPVPIAGSDFGFSVDVEGERIVIGEPKLKDSATAPGGSAHVFDRIGGVWTLTQSLQPSYLRDKQLFGYSVALNASDLAIGAPFEIPVVPPFSEIGSVFMFGLSGTTWSESARLQPAAAVKKWQFGSSVDLAFDRLLAGAESADAFFGRSYIFDRDSGGAWNESATLAPDGLSMFGNFGGAVRLTEDGTTAVIAAGGDSFPQPAAGAVYVFSEDGGAWTLDEKLQPSDAVAGARFGESAAVQANVLAVGVSASDALLDSAGAAHLHSLDDSACSSLTPTARSLSLSSGGLVTFLVDPGAEYAGKTYLIAGSLTGTDPGFLLDGFQIPLNPDVYFNLLTSFPNLALFSGNRGTLSSLGQGAGFLSLPPTFVPSLAGTNVFHAAVVLESDGTLLHVSDAALLRLDP